MLNEYECCIVLDDFILLIEDLLVKYLNKLLMIEGFNGVCFYNGIEIVYVFSIVVDVVDIIGVGDIFNGVLVVVFFEGEIF